MKLFLGVLRSVLFTAIYIRQLDLNTVVVRECCDSEGVKYVREAVASQPAQAILVRLTASQQATSSFTASLDSQLPHTNAVGKQFCNLTGHCPSHSDSYPKRTDSYNFGPNPKGMTFEARLVAKNDSGNIRSTEGGGGAETCDVVTLMFVAATGSKSPHRRSSREGNNLAADCTRDFKKIAGRSCVKLHADPVAYSQELFSRIPLPRAASPACCLGREPSRKEMRGHHGTAFAGAIAPSTHKHP